jgi:SRSO17 transposase
MDAKRIQQLRPLLDKYLLQFSECFARSESAERLRNYVSGQLSDLPRKSIEPMADAANLPPRTLQQFLSLHHWDEGQMRDILQQIVAREHAHRLSVGILDETGFSKKGVKTPGVQRQWCGRAGKTDNCTITVHLGYAAGDFHCLLDGELFLPESWSSDRARCDQAGIPDTMAHRPKWRIGLELIERAVANGIRFEWMTCDEGYSQSPEFLFALDDRGQRYVVEIPKIFYGWLVKPSVLTKRRRFGPRTDRKFPRLKVKNPPLSTVENLLSHSPVLREIPWEKFHIKDTTKGAMVWQAKAVPFYLRRDELPTWPHWLIVARNIDDPDEVKYFLSNAPDGTPLEVLLHVAFSRWHVERCFEDEKSELGLGHFEVRNYRSLKRHLILTAVSHLFLAKVHQDWRGEKPRPDGVPTSHGQFCSGPIVVADGPSTRTSADSRGANHHGTTTTIRPRFTQPYQNTTTAAA